MHSKSKIAKIDEKNKLFRKRFKLVSIMMIAFLALYVPSVLNWIIAEEVVVDMLQTGNIEISTNTEGYIVRNEVILKSPFGGKYFAEIREGEKVSVNGTVFTVLRDESSTFANELDQIDTKIIEVQRNKNENIEIFTNDIKKINDQISEKVNIIIKDLNTNEISKIKNYKDEIDTLMRKKAIISAGSQNADKYFLDLKKQREGIVEKINLNKKEIKSEHSGIVSYLIDGYEGILNTKSIKKMDYLVLKDIKNQAVFTELSDRKAETEKPIAKIILDDEYMILVTIKKEDIEKYKLKSWTKIRIIDIDKVVDGQIESISREVGGYFEIGVKVNQALIETAGLRKVKVDIIRESYEGLKIPIGALQEFDEKHHTGKIIIVSGGIAKIVEVNVKGLNDTFAIIGNKKDKPKVVNLYDRYVINHKNVQAGQFINNDVNR